jgi:hypothetical protein
MRYLRLDERVLVRRVETTPPTTENEPQFFEPQLPDADSDDWQEILRQIFATEVGIWQRRAIARLPAPLSDNPPDALPLRHEDDVVHRTGAVEGGAAVGEADCQRVVGSLFER